MSQEAQEQKRADECNDGASEWVCFDCGDKYSDKKAYDGTFTCHTGTCYICQEQATVSSSRKIFGHHRFL